jgi:Tol biopolymer transport system component
MDAVGRHVRLLVEQTGNLFFHTVRWSADGSRLYLIHGLQNEQRIFALPLEGGTLEEITDPTSGAAVQRDFDLDPNDLSMSISPDGQHSAFVAYRQGLWGLYIGDASRRDAHFLTDAGRQFNEPPIWSRDGRHIAYVAWLGDQVDVFVLDPRSSPPVIQRLTNDHAIEAGVAWRPQGR